MGHVQGAEGAHMLVVAGVLFGALVPEGDRFTSRGGK